MTGGLGFSRHGQDSFKQNRELLNKRPNFKSRPNDAIKYDQDQSKASAYQQILEWKSNKDKNARRLRLAIFAALFLTLILRLLIFLL